MALNDEQLPAAHGFPVERRVMRTRSDIDPAEWAKHADGCMTCSKHRRQRGVTRWLDGRTKPARAGWYERLFTDGVLRHYWNGKVWAALRNGQPHWRQVGDYPCWRGLTCTAFISPSRYPVARAPNAKLAGPQGR